MSCWDKATKSFKEYSQTSNWHRHDLRRTAATYMGNLGFHTDVIEAVLGHAIGTNQSRHYNHSDYKYKAKEARQKFADCIDQLEKQGLASIPPEIVAEIKDKNRFSYTTIFT